MRSMQDLSHSFMLLVTVFSTAHCWTEFCRGGSVVTMSSADCPGGILFRDPQPWQTCLVPLIDNGDREHIANICDSEMDVAVSNKIQYVDVGTDDADGPSGDSYSTCKAADKCTGQYLALNSANTQRGAVDDNSIEIKHESDLPDMPDVQNQTLRLFMYITGHLIDENDDGPNLNLVQLMKRSFNVTAKYAPASYLKPEFFQTIQRAFLFLLRESDTGGIHDVGKDTYNRLSKSLEECESMSDAENRLYFDGKICQTTAKVDIRAEKEIRAFAKHTRGGLGNVTARYTPNEQSYVWGKYDFPVEAAWAVMNFVHGHCYRAFRKNVNDHHLYQYAIERLFTRELLFRWKNPPKLKYEPYWDHIFRANVKVSMRNVDAMVAAVYHENPFVHKVRRPWINQEDAATIPITMRRRRRQAMESAWCLQSSEEKNEKIEELRKLCSA